MGKPKENNRHNRVGHENWRKRKADSQKPKQTWDADKKQWVR